MSVEQRILNFIEEGCDKPSWEGKELRAIALEVRKREDRIKQLEREVQILRLYGNKDCTAMADEALTKETKQ